MSKKLFDFVIGNPPYQENGDTNNRSQPLYPLFYDASEIVSSKYMLITPARFLFNAGLTAKDWNKKMLSDENLKVERYEQDGTAIFPNTDIKGGVAIIYRNDSKKLGPIGNFIPNDLLRNIANKVQNKSDISLSSIMYGGRSDLKFNDVFLKDYPESVADRLRAIQEKHPTVTKLGPNEEYELKSPTLDVLSYAFSNHPLKETDYKILGLVNGKRGYRWISRKYMVPRYPNNNNINGYKIFIPKASGKGELGEALGTPVISVPGESSTPTFISIGNFKNIESTKNCEKYIRTKFARLLLSILKITQDVVPSKWKYVPLQDFTPDSDIDWSKSIHEIDRQLYRKYDLSEAEINFVETNVKEME